MKKAMFIKEILGWVGKASLYKVNPPIKYPSFCVGKEKQKKTSYVIVSAVCAMFSGPETYIFPADKNGKVLDWSELEGSFHGSLDHGAALKGAGYEKETVGNKEV